MAVSHCRAYRVRVRGLSVCGAAGMLTEDGRTALMYAAANGTLPMIRLLLNAGADPHQADAKGKRALDYLQGSGPVPPNPVLNPADRATAARLLF